MGLQPLPPRFASGNGIAKLAITCSGRLWCGEWPFGFAALPFYVSCNSSPSTMVAIRGAPPRQLDQGLPCPPQTRPGDHTRMTVPQSAHADCGGSTSMCRLRACHRARRRHDKPARMRIWDGYSIDRAPRGQWRTTRRLQIDA